MNYRLNKDILLEVLSEWNRFVRLIQHFHKMISYDISEKRLLPNIDHFVELLRKKNLYG